MVLIVCVLALTAFAAATEGETGLLLKLEARIAELENRERDTVAKLENQKEDMKKQNRELSTKVDSLVLELGEAKQQINRDANLERRVAQLEAVVETLMTRNRDLETTLGTRTTQLEEALEKERQKTTTLQASLLPSQSSPAVKSAPVGTFSGYINGTFTYAQYQAVVFPNINYNSGDYDTTTGVFTSPVSAVYAFNLNLVSCGTGYRMMTVRVRKGSTTLGYVSSGYTQNTVNWYRLNGSGTIIVNVQMGETVTVDASSMVGTSYCLFGSTFEGYSFYSAFLIDTTV